MSLADPGDEYSELIPEGANKIGKFAKKMRFYVLILVIGIILGAYLQFAYLDPVVKSAELGSCSDCTLTKGLLQKENACLYQILPNPQSASQECRQANSPIILDTNPVVDGSAPPSTMPANPDGDVTLPDINQNKDFNEEAPQL